MKYFQKYEDNVEKVEEKGKNIEERNDKVEEIFEKEEEVEEVKKINIVDGMNELYLEYQEVCPVQEDIILLESQNGKGISESIIALMDVLQKEPEYQSYKIYFSSVRARVEQRRKYLNTVGFKNIRVLTYDTAEYYRILATAKYLITDACFRSTFIKRKEQVYLKFWAHTQLNFVGRRQSVNYAQNGVVQKNLFDADYIVCPNEFTKNVLQKDYMIENFGRGKFLMSDGFQAEMILDEERREEIRKKFKLEDKKAFVYIPQGKPLEEYKVQYIESLWEDFKKLDKNLDDSHIVYVSLSDDILQEKEFTEFKHIKKLPKIYGQYRMLSAVDGLITDYSNLIFEYASCKRKIILLQLESEKYIEQKDIYKEMLQMPFPKATSIELLAEEIKCGKKYDDTKFLETYCKYSKKGMASLICAKVILGQEKEELEVQPIADNGKKNVVIYAGGLEKNGITSSIINILSNVNTKRNNYMLIYRMEFVRDDPKILKDLPKDVVWYGYSYVRGVSRRDTALYAEWLCEIEYTKEAREMLYRRAEHEKDRLLSHCRIDHVVQYNGYGTDMIMTMQQMPCGRTVYVHNDMIKEVETKSGMSKEVLSVAYQSYDTIALVSEDHRNITKTLAQLHPLDVSSMNLDTEQMEVKTKKTSLGLASITTEIANFKAGTRKIRLGKRTIKLGTRTIKLNIENIKLDTKNIKLAKNIIDYEKILGLAGKEFSIDESTILSVEEETLRNILNSSAKKFMTIGRFSSEKGHSRLIDAFVEVHKENPDTYLIILGGYGTLYEETLQKAQEVECKDNIIIIQYLSNPFALLKRCDYFVLSSFHEGLPVVLAEADILGKPSISTDIEGPRLFLKRYGGNLVKNDTEGIIKGMKKCLAGTIKKRLNIDYEQYNEEAIEQFEALINKKS